MPAPSRCLLSSPGPWGPGRFCKRTCEEHCPPPTSSGVCARPQGSLCLFPLPPWAVSALRAVVWVLGGDSSPAPSGRPVTAGTCSHPSPLRWSPATDSPAIFLTVRTGQGGCTPHPTPTPAACLVCTSCLGPFPGRPLSFISGHFRLCCCQIHLQHAGSLRLPQPVVLHVTFTLVFLPWAGPLRLLRPASS